MHSWYTKGEKTCRTCNVTKDYRSYYQASGNADGYENQCKPCKNNSRDPVKLKAYRDKWRAEKKAQGHYGKCEQCGINLGRSEGNRKKTPYCKDCCKGELHPNYTGGYENGHGYRVVYVAPRKTMMEHRKVMQDHIGRELYPDENVHHINGVRNDNRIENLELWSTSQPSGQRVEDKIAWAKELLRRYDEL